MDKKNLVPHIAIVGTGQLGSRHLQGLARLDRDIVVDVMDPDTAALALARQRFDQMSPNLHKQSVRYISTQTDYESDLDLAIIATNADVRLHVIKSLLTNVYVRYLILEKVAFQSVRDFETVIRILDEKRIKAWVNCPRRIFPFFRELKEETILSDSIKICVKGSSWGLASNAIHMLDLLAFLTGQTEVNIDITELDNEVYESKRDGFIELGGRLLAETGRGDLLELVDDKKKGILFQMSIEFSGKRLDIDQQQGLISIYLNDTIKSEKPFHVPLQSEMTAGVVEHILENGNSNLTPLDKSYLLHRPMLDAFNQHLSRVLNKLVKICPIT